VKVRFLPPVVLWHLMPVNTRTLREILVVDGQVTQ
jgi:hypothetical protein